MNKLVIAESCRDCDRRAIKLFSREPNDEEVKEIGVAIGDMTCIVYQELKELIDRELEIEVV